MKAMLLAAGKATPGAIPKPMIPLVRKPVMEYLLDHLKTQGITDVLVSTSHASPLIEEYFRDGDRYGMNLAYAFEEGEGPTAAAPLGTAGVMKKIQSFSGFFNETFVVLSGDAMVDVDLSAVLQFHRERNSIATLVLRDVPAEDVWNYRMVQLHDAGRIIQFQQNPTWEIAVSATVETGIYLFEPEIFRHIPEGLPFDIATDLLPALLQQDERMYGLSLPFRTLDIGSVPGYWAATRLLLAGDLANFTMPGREVRPGIHCGENVRIDWDHVHIEGKVYIGSSTSIGDGVTIVGPTVIGSGCIIPPGTTLRECILADNTRIYSPILEQKLIFGSRCIDASGQAQDIDDSRLRWWMDDVVENSPSFLRPTPQ